MLRDALRPYRSSLTPKLWSVLDTAKPGDPRLLPAAGALALYDPESPRWANNGSKVAETLVGVNSLVLGPWLEALRPVRDKLTGPLVAILRDKQRPETVHSLATDILTDYASDQPDLLAELLMAADLKAFPSLFAVVERQAAKTLPMLRAEVARDPKTGEKTADSEHLKDRLAERQARAAVALVRLGRADEVWPLIRHGADPRLRSFMLNWLSPLGAEPDVIATELDRLDSLGTRHPPPATQKMDTILFHPETSMRRALILALGTYGSEKLSLDKREPLTSKLLDLYRNDPDAGIHGAVEWTLRQWGHQESLKSADDELFKLKNRGERRWYVNGQGQTFAVIDGPIEFRMGSHSGRAGSGPRRDSPSSSHPPPIGHRVPRR